jgi:hypothetical protein
MLQQTVLMEVIPYLVLSLQLVVAVEVMPEQVVQVVQVVVEWIIILAGQVQSVKVALVAMGRGLRIMALVVVVVQAEPV